MRVPDGRKEAPVKLKRLREVDALRSFALGGILMVNIWYFADPFTVAGEISPAHDSPADVTVRFTVAALFEAKFYLLFSFLFGYSFVLQWQAAVAASASPVQRMSRRLTALLVLGLLHGTFLFFGDILLTYALMGFILLATYSIRTSAAVIAGSALIGIVGSAILVVGLFVAVASVGLPPVGFDVDADALVQSPDSAFFANVDNFLNNVAGVVLFQGPLSLAMFYLGLAAGRVGLLSGQLSRRALTTTASVALPVGLTAGAIQAYLTNYVDAEQFSVLAVGISTLTAPLLAAGYVSLLLLFFRTTTGGRFRDFLTPAGRIALTNYLMQSLIMAFLFTAYGLRLSDQLPAAAVAGIAVVIYAAQLVFSRILLSRVSMGPMEWLMRRITYGARRAQAVRN